MLFGDILKAADKVKKTKKHIVKTLQGKKKKRVWRQVKIGHNTYHWRWVTIYE